MIVEKIKLEIDSKVLVIYDNGTTEVKKARGLSFKPDMMKANFEDRKTQTRRVINPQPLFTWNGVTEKWIEWKGKKYDIELLKDCCKEKPGDLIYCREMFYRLSVYDTYQSKWIGQGELIDINKIKYPKYEYIENKNRVDLFNENSVNYFYRKKPSIHMPREAARLWLILEKIWIEQVQDISIKDAEKEGVEVGDNNYADVSEFINLWDSINAKRKDKHGKLLNCSWADNPWVIVRQYRKFYEGRAINK